MRGIPLHLRTCIPHPPVRVKQRLRKQRLQNKQRLLEQRLTHLSDRVNSDC